MVLAVGSLTGCGDGGVEQFEGSLAPVLDVQPTSGRKPQTDLAPTARFNPADYELTSCDEVPPLKPESAGRPSGIVDLDAELMKTLAAYGEANDDSFAGLWLDGESTGGVLLAFADDAYGHRDEIMAALDGDGWGAPFSVVEVPNSARALSTVGRDVLDLDIPSVESARVNLQINRVEISLLDPTDEDLTDLSLNVDPVQACVMVTTGPEIPTGPLAVLPLAGRSPLLNCDEFPFPSSALEEPVPAIGFDHPAVAVLAEILEEDPGWIILSAGDDHALFGNVTGQDVQASVLVAPNGGAWEIESWTFGCDLRIGLPRNLGSVEVFLDPDGPPSAEDRTLSLVVAEVACSGGREMGRRLLDPEVVETDTAVMLAYAAVSQEAEFIDCGSNPATEVTVTLSAPLDGRALLDGTFIPPRPISLPPFTD